MLSSLLLLVILAIPVLAILVPLALSLSREWDRLFWSLALLLAVVNVFLFVEGLHTESGMGAAFAFTVNGVSTIVFLVPVVTRLLFSRETYSQEEQDQYWLDGKVPYRRLFPEASLGVGNLGSALIAFTFGAVIPLMCLVWAAVFARTSGRFVFALLALTALLAIVGAMKVRRAPILRQALVWLAITCTLTIPYGWWSAREVADSAKANAGDTPFCLEGGGKVLTTLTDLSILTLRERPDGQGIRYDNHAVLVIDDGQERFLMNWSYFHHGFRADIQVDRINESVGPDIVCTPIEGGGLTAF